MGSCATLDLAAYRSTTEAVRRDPASGQGAFRTVTEWQDGARARTTARSFAIDTDEPTPLGGTDRGVDPMELLLAALGTCLQIGWVTQAARRGLELRSLRIEVSGDYDLRGYLAVDEGVRPGFGRITYDVHLDSDATPVQLADIREQVERTSPMFDNVRDGAPVEAVVLPG